MPATPVHRLILTLDIEQYGRADRDDEVRVWLRRSLREVLADTLSTAGVAQETWSATSTGDGLLVLVDPAIAKATVLRALVDRLADGLTAHNRRTAVAAQLRVRAVVHAGELLLDDQGAVGAEVNLAFRLLDSLPLRDLLRHADGPLALCVSEYVFHQVVRHRHLHLDPAAFAPVQVTVKETTARAWLYDGTRSNWRRQPSASQQISAHKEAGDGDLDAQIESTLALIRAREDQRLYQVTGHRVDIQQQLRELYDELERYRVQRDALHPNAGSAVRFVHSYSLPVRWAARNDEQAILTELVDQGRQRVIAVVAMGGTGKTALVRHLLEVRPDLLGGLDGCLWFSFYVESDVDRFLSEACRYLLPEFDPTETPSPFAKLARLQECLRQRRCLLILDGLETMLDTDRQRSSYGTCNSKILRELLAGMCASGTASQLLVTSRVPLTDLDGQAGYHQLNLGDLSPQAAVDFVAGLGVRGPAEIIGQVCARYGHHALSLYVLADYLLQPPLTGDIADAWTLSALPDETPQGRKLHAILDGYWRRLTVPERFFMTRLAAARTGVTDDQLGLLAVDDHGAACETTHPVFHRTLRRMRQSALLQFEQRGRHSSYTAHPLIKSYFYGRLHEVERRRIHRDWQTFLAARPTPRQPRSLEELHTRIETYHHAVQATRYDEAYGLYHSEELNSWLLWWGHYTLAVDLLQPLLNAYDHGTWPAPAKQISRLFGDAANHLAKAGLPAQALLYHARAVAIPELPLTEQSRAWQYLSELLAEMGQFDHALATLRHAEALEHHLDRPQRAYLIVGRQGYYRAGLGRMPSALQQLTDAIGQCEADTASGTSSQGYRCLYHRIRGDLHLHLGQLDTAAQDYRAALSVSHDAGRAFIDYEGHALRGLGDIHRLQQRFDDAYRCYERAQRIADDAAYSLLQTEVAVGFARLALAQGDLAEATRKAEGALALARGGWLTQTIHSHLILAKVYARQDDQAQHRQAIWRAGQLIASCNDPWAQQELARITAERGYRDRRPDEPIGL